MRKTVLKPWRDCQKNSAIIETWLSGGKMYMVKCNNPDCPVPPDGYPTGRDTAKLIEEWNDRHQKTDNGGKIDGEINT